MLGKILRKMGLSEKENEIYSLLLHEGSKKASEISSILNLNRSATYGLLNRMEEKGFLNHIIIGGKKYFDAPSPEKLRFIIKEKQEELNELESDLEKAIPKLLRRNKASSIKVEVYSGIGGYKTLMEDILHEGKDYCVLGYGGMGQKIAPLYERVWQKRRIRKKIWRNLLASAGLKNHRDLKYKYTRVKFLPENYSTGAYAIVYGDKSIIFLPREREFTGILIINEEVARSYYSNFKLLWESAK